MAKKINMDAGTEFIFITMMQSALKGRDMGMTQDMYVEFAKGIWESMLLTEESELKEIMQDYMMGQLKDFAKHI